MQQFGLVGAEEDEAMNVLLGFRAAHAYPLVKANNGLRDAIMRAGCTAPVTQRLKRVPTILDKLRREPTLDLYRMQDIGGVRAVLDTTAQVYEIAKILRRRPSFVDERDYIRAPRVSGYRAMHVVVKYDDRTIEIQLRTQVMHAWAYTVERAGGRTHANFKGDGDHPVQELFKVVSEAMALEEQGKVVDNDLQQRLWEARKLAQPYLG